MIQLELHAGGLNRTQLQTWIQSRLFEIPQDSVLKIKVYGKISNEALSVLSAPLLRALAPVTMNIDATLMDYIDYANR